MLLKANFRLGSERGGGEAEKEGGEAEIKFIG